MRYFMELAYRGAPFHGWQIQPNDVSVQSTIEDALAMVLRRSIKITGAGRTDTGVNASMMVAHLDLENECPDAKKLVRALNSIVGKDIAIYGLTEVHSDAHARFDATSRTYHYYTHTFKSPFCYPLSWRSPLLDYDKMNEAASMLREVSDFTSFAKLHADTKTNVCRLDRAEWIEEGQGRWTFVITADRFLRNMVRAVTGTLVDVGRGKLSVNGFMEIVEAKNRCAAGTSMPAHPLFLQRVEYPYYRSIQESVR